jgi:hypothetical protein
MSDKENKIVQTPSTISTFNEDFTSVSEGNYYSSSSRD